MCIPGLFSKPAAPPPVAPITPPPPVIDPTIPTAESQAAKQKQQRAAALAKGQASTILTTPLGVPGPATTGKATLLGYTA